LVGLIDRSLERSLRAVNGSPKRLDEAMRYCVLSGGKRFRPLLCLGGCEAAGGRPEQALAAACAIELIHTYSLVHDDLPAMDDADERRGRPSCHRKFGEALAILVGDALLTRAFELLSRDGASHTVAILRTIAQASGTTGLIGGQVLDLQSTVHSPQSTVKRLEETARRKTAALITASVVAGGLAGRASTEALSRLRGFGQRLGLAFQLKDDLHDGDGLVGALGREAVDWRARHLIAAGERFLRPFGQRAWLLRALSAWLTES
jgi:geranylgeranyl diphosphate synthase type II